MCFQRKPIKEIGTTLVEFKPFQKKLNFHISIVEAFKKLLKKGMPNTLEFWARMCLQKKHGKLPMTS
jgi:hypothetical protein